MTREDRAYGFISGLKNVAHKANNAVHNTKDLILGREMGTSLANRRVKRESREYNKLLKSSSEARFIHKRDQHRGSEFNKGNKGHTLSSLKAAVADKHKRTAELSKARSRMI